jgi:hypothetical protein
MVPGGGGWAGGWAGRLSGRRLWRVSWRFGPLPLPVSVVVSPPPGLASLVVVSAFYSGSVIGAERAA